MSLASGFGGLFVKEAKELLREKRLFVILGVLTAVLALPFTFFLRNAVRYGEYVPSPNDLAMPLVFILPIALVIAALTFAADMVSKEKDSGMLGLVLSAPVTTEGFLLAKIAGAYLVYGIVALAVILFGLVLSLGFGLVIAEILVWFFLIPYLALWTFLVGLGLLVSVMMGGSKSAVGVGIAVYLPLFLLTPLFLGELIREVAPRFYLWLDYNPFAMAIGTGSRLANGYAFDLLPIATTVLAGLVLGATAYVLFRRQEVAG